MATQRYISTSFWTDKWVRSINPADRYLYIYLLTNPQTNIAGVYQITLDRIAFDTGYDERTLVTMLERFGEQGKAYFYDEEWVIIPSWPDHQRWEKSQNTRAGIIARLEECPDHVLRKAEACGYKFNLDLVKRNWKEPEVKQNDEEYSKNANKTGTLDPPSQPLEGASEPHGRESNYSDLDLDLDLDSSKSLNPSDSSVVEPVSLPPLKDDFARQVEETFTGEYPPSSWGSIAKERGAVKTIVKKVRQLRHDSPFEDDTGLFYAMFKAFLKLRHDNAATRYWVCAITPSDFLGRWNPIVAELTSQYETAEAVHRGKQSAYAEDCPI